MTETRIRTDLADLEIEEATSNSPFKKVPARRGPSDHSGRYNDEGIAVENADGILGTSYDQNRPPSPPNFPFGRTSEGSAFRRIDSPGHTRSRSFKGQLTPKQETFTPGEVFSPDETFVGGSIKRAGSRKNESGDHEGDEEYLGAFQHHIPVPTPLENNSKYTSGGTDDFGGLAGDSGSSPSTERILGLLSASSPELNLMGIVSQLINNPKWSPGQGDSPEHITSLLGAVGGGRSSGSENALEGLSRSDLLQKFNEMHIGDDDDDDDDFGGSSVLGQGGPALTNSPPRPQDRRGQRYGGFPGESRNIAPEGYDYRATTDGRGNNQFDAAHGGPYPGQGQQQQQQSQYGGTQTNRVQQSQQDYYYGGAAANPYTNSNTGTGTGANPGISSGIFPPPSELSSHYAAPEFVPSSHHHHPQHYQQQHQQQLHQQQQQQQHRSSLESGAFDLRGSGPPPLAPKSSEAGPWVPGGGYNYDPSAVGMALTMSSSFDTTGSHSVSNSQNFMQGSFQPTGRGHPTPYYGDPGMAELRRSGASVSDRFDGMNTGPGSLRNSYEGGGMAAMRSSYNSQSSLRSSIDGGEPGSFRNSYDDAYALRASSSSQLHAGFGGGPPPPPPGPPPGSAVDAAGIWGQQPQQQYHYQPAQNVPQPPAYPQVHEAYDPQRLVGGASERPRGPYAGPGPAYEPYNQPPEYRQYQHQHQQPPPPPPHQPPQQQHQGMMPPAPQGQMYDQHGSYYPMPPARPLQPPYPGGPEPTPATGYGPIYGGGPVPPRPRPAPGTDSFGQQPYQPPDAYMYGGGYHSSASSGPGAVGNVGDPVASLRSSWEGEMSSAGNFNNSQRTAFQQVPMQQPPSYGMQQETPAGIAGLQTSFLQQPTAAPLSTGMGPQPPPPPPPGPAPNTFQKPPSTETRGQAPPPPPPSYPMPNKQSQQASAPQPPPPPPPPVPMTSQGRVSGRHPELTTSSSISSTNISNAGVVSSNSSVASSTASSKGGARNSRDRALESKVRPTSGAGPAVNDRARPSAESKTNVSGAAAGGGSGAVPGPGQVRQDLIESPQSKLAYKDFYKQFRSLERDSIEAAQHYAEDSLSSMPERVKWRVLLELADLAKRSNDFEKARKLYSAVVELQPLASQGWLEWSKMEEECGHLKYSLKILRRGLEKCNYNESLLTKAIKQQERLHNMQEARAMLSVLKHESIERVWKAVLEGALLEARAGRIVVARKFLRYLMEHVAWYGPIYFEAFKLEERDERDDAAFSVVKKGLSELPRYGPLWFGLLRIVERRDAKKECRGWLLGRPPVLKRLRDEVALSIKSISRELVWKVHFERAQAEERAADLAAAGLNNLSSRSLGQARDALLGNARAALLRAVLTCPSNLHWKVWLAGARLELSAGSIAKARKLLCKAFATVPSKSRSHVFLECSRIEEYAGNIDGARRILARARDEVKGEWKVFLESVLLEARAGNMRGAVKAAEQALDIHAGTGRLWALLIQICHRLEGIVPRNQPGNAANRRPLLDTAEECKPSAEDGIYSSSAFQDDEYPVPTKKDVLLRALNEVPKSGEVWCEGARCHLNPLHLDSFDLSSAQKYLCFAIQFTPQYGDTFIESLRLEMILQCILPRVLKLYGLPLVPFLRRFLNEDCEADIVSLLGDFGWLQSVCGAGLTGIAPRTGVLEYSADASGAFNSTGAAAGGGTSGATISGAQQYYAEGVFSVPASPISRQSRRRDIDAIERMDLDIGHLVEAYKSVCTRNLTRRCTNSDPNYGAVWFHCRQRSFDTPSTVLKTAVDLVAFELVAAQPVYVRAVSHYVRRCVERYGMDGKNKLMAGSSGSSSSSAAVGVVSAVADAKTPDTSSSAKAANAAAAASSSSSSSSSAVIAEGDIELMNLLTAQEDGVDQSAREEELLADFRIAESIQGINWPTGAAANSVPIVQGGRDGIVFAAPDFVTASIDMNRLVFNRHLSNEDRRKVLLSSDQIIP